LIQRSGLDEPSALLFVAHRAALDLPVPAANDDSGDGITLVLPTGSVGHFRVVLRAGRYGTGGEGDIALTVFCHTWISAEQQERPSTPGARLPGEGRLGESWLSPSPFRTVVRLPDGRVAIERWTGLDGVRRRADGASTHDLAAADGTSRGRP